MHTSVVEDCRSSLGDNCIQAFCTTLQLQILRVPQVLWLDCLRLRSVGYGALHGCAWWQHTAFTMPVEAMCSSTETSKYSLSPPYQPPHTLPPPPPPCTTHFLLCHIACCKVVEPMLQGFMGMCRQSVHVCRSQCSLLIDTIATVSVTVPHWFSGFVIFSAVSRE